MGRAVDWMRGSCRWRRPGRLISRLRRLMVDRLVYEFRVALALQVPGPAGRHLTCRTRISHNSADRVDWHGLLMVLAQHLADVFSRRSRFQTLGGLLVRVV